MTYILFCVRWVKMDDNATATSCVRLSPAIKENWWKSALRTVGETEMAVTAAAHRFVVTGQQSVKSIQIMWFG